MPMKSMAMTVKTAQWMDLPGRPGMKLSPIWMNPITQQSVGLVKFMTEMKQPKHMHPYASTYYVIEGAMTASVDGKEQVFGPGSIVYRAPKEVHTTSARAGTIVYSVTDGPMIDLDEKGQPLPPSPQTAQK
jgi:mannose-6-phosphate isomerase-like protein (cupin superfamily)